MIFNDNIKGILINMWPTLLLVSVVSFSMRITYFIKNKEKIIFYKDLMAYLFILYILCLFYVVTFQDVSWSSSNFMPFKEILRYEIGTRLFYKNVALNVFMFVPFGLFVSYFLHLKKIYSISILTLLTSITIEVTQLMIGRVFDVDDLFLNLIGGMLGFLLYKAIYGIVNKLPDFLKKDYIYNIIMLFFVVGVIIYLARVVM